MEDEDKEPELFYPRHLVIHMKKQIIRLVNGYVNMYNYNVEHVFLASLKDLTKQLHATISQMIDTYIIALQTLASLLLETTDGFLINRVSETILDVYDTFVSRLNRELRLVRMHLLQLEKFLALHGWHLIHVQLLLFGSQPSEIAQGVVDHIRQTVVPGKSRLVQYTDSVVERVLNPLVATIVNHIRELAWLEEHLFCTKDQTPEKQYDALTDHVLNEHFPNIYKKDEYWFYISNV